VRSNAKAFVARFAVFAQGAHRASRAAVSIALVASFAAAPSAAYAVWSPSSYQTLTEQVASQKMLTALVNNEIASLYIGRARVRSGAMYAPVTARMRNGTSMLGTLVLKQYKRRWYFYSITAGSSAGGISNVSVPSGITSGILRTAVAQQTSNQSFALGIQYGRFRLITIRSVSRNWGTASASVRLSGGSSRARDARISFLSKVAGTGKTYWFLVGVR